MVSLSGLWEAQIVPVAAVAPQPPAAGGRPCQEVHKCQRVRVERSCWLPSKLPSTVVRVTRLQSARAQYWARVARQSDRIQPERPSSVAPSLSGRLSVPQIESANLS